MRLPYRPSQLSSYVAAPTDGAAHLTFRADGWQKRLSCARLNGRTRRLVSDWLPGRPALRAITSCGTFRLSRRRACFRFRVVRFHPSTRESQERKERLTRAILSWTAVAIRDVRRPEFKHRRENAARTEPSADRPTRGVVCFRSIPLISRIGARECGVKVFQGVRKAEEARRETTVKSRGKIVHARKSVQETRKIRGTLRAAWSRAGDTEDLPARNPAGFAEEQTAPAVTRCPGDEEWAPTPLARMCYARMRLARGTLPYDNNSHYIDSNTRRPPAPAPSCRSWCERWSRGTCAVATCRRVLRVGRWVPSWRPWRTVPSPAPSSNWHPSWPPRRTSSRTSPRSWPMSPTGVVVCAVESTRSKSAWATPIPRRYQSVSN